MGNFAFGKWFCFAGECESSAPRPDHVDRTICDLLGTYAPWLATEELTVNEVARIVDRTARRIGEIRARYVDETRVITGLVERLTA